MNDAPADWLEVERYVEQFEAAWRRQGFAVLGDFLPAPGDPLRPRVLCELACIDMELSWRESGRGAAYYCERFPELAQDARAALEEQEQRLAHEASDADRPASDAEHARTLRRDEGWRGDVAALYERHCRLAVRAPAGLFPGSLDHADLLGALAEADPDAARCFAEVLPTPAPGSDLFGFRLVCELGRGTFGQVFLAEETGLANRPVALKVGIDLFGESQVLAQLQHNNIVPIYSAHGRGRLQALCMPFFGPTTLADVLAAMRRQGGAPTIGNALWSTLNERCGEGTPAAGPRPALDKAAPAPPLATLEKLRRFPHERAVLWIGACLADALGHAHERGILHRDLKPANILLADDGTPMLLDFNLSHDARLRGGMPAILGGTLPYMAPEHLQAFQDAAKQVDARSDLYSLGLILHELLTGRPAFPTHEGPLREQVARMIADRLAGPPPLAGGKGAASPAVQAIIRRCLEPDPASRYASARALEEDARRQLDDLPLRHTPEPSWRERARKFMRRHPRLGWGAIAAALSGLALALAWLYVNLGRHAERVEAASARLEHQEELRDARILLGLPYPDPLELAEGEALCRKALARYGLPDAEDWESGPLAAALAPDQRALLREDLGELFLLLARATRLQGALLPLPERQRRLDEALRLNEKAENLIGERDARSLLLQRALLYRLADKAGAESLLERGRSLPLASARDHYLLASELCSQGEVREAGRLLEQATTLEPENAAAWAARGACHAAMGDSQRSLAAFTTCIALRPGFWRGYLWRGQAYLEAQDFARAEADFDQVLAKRADFAPALTFRALARLGKKDFAGARADLSTAIDRSAGHTRLYFIRSRAAALAGDAEAARRDFEEGLRLVPSDELSWVARGVARLPRDPALALADFDEALKLNPWSRLAAQNKAHVLADHLKRHEDAIKVLDPVVVRYPDFVEARIGRAVLRARLGQRDAAHEDVAQSLLRDTRPLILYQAACVHALTSPKAPADRLEAFRLLHRAIAGGFGADLLERDADLASLRGQPEYRRLVELAGLKSSP